MNDTTTFNVIEWFWGGHYGYIHPLAFRATRWDMEYGRDGFMRPCVCDTSVEHNAWDTVYHNEKIPIIPPWNGKEWVIPGQLD